MGALIYGLGLGVILLLVIRRVTKAPRHRVKSGITGPMSAEWLSSTHHDPKSPGSEP